MKIIPASDTALIIKAGDDISIATNTYVRQLYRAIECLNIHGINEMVPTFNELTIYYDPIQTDFRGLINCLHDLERNASVIDLPKGKLWRIPVQYGGEAGPDLDYLASHTGLDANEVIGLHASVDYHVFMLGFTPGFCYLGGLDPRLACPRKQTPSLKIAAGSVGIAGNQTGIYPIQSPGGWQIIGRTPIRLFDPLTENPFLIRAGDKLRFQQVDKSIFREIELAAEAGNFIPEYSQLT
jgi:KipI family sensor histidine kinase inhibitor